MTTYNYDAVGNLQNFIYPNGVTHAYSYDALNRLTQMGTSKNASAISNYTYMLGARRNGLLRLRVHAVRIDCDAHWADPLQFGRS